MAEKHRARKRFGQHFLTDPDILQRIAAAFSPRDQQNLVEIGPGLGALTEVLLGRADHLTVIELDRDLASRLSRRYSSDRLSVHQMDILQCELSDLPRRNPTKNLRLIGNLPYNISSPLLFHLLRHINVIDDMLFMLQKEVALRLTAEPGSKNYGRLSVMTQIDLQSELLFHVPPAAFDPPPRVDSSIIRLWPRTDPLEVERDRLSKIVTAAFGQRRKTLCNALSQVVSLDQFEIAAVAPGSRAEALSLEDFIRLANAPEQVELGS